MTTTKLVSIVAKRAKVTRKVAAAVVKSLTGAIHDSLRRNEKIAIAGLGTFRVMERAARNGIHPRTLARINIPATRAPAFRSAKGLKEAIKLGEQAESALDVRDEVERLLREGEALPAFDLAMKSLIRSRREFGSDDHRTAACMVTVAEAAIHREKYHLAGVLYRKALSIKERAFGPSHPDVVFCKTRLSNLETDHSG